ncbi:MAG TPA: glutamate synthase subunit beta [Chromatiales bacterium]|jgi:glutamate synthase (NADPH/NADH) small chain|nr:glutamate synthase subunit beta [Chromatiaceae bacterium]HIN82916.1 glutamate synthase subunit beta [Chromatiales bacterium]
MGKPTGFMEIPRRDRSYAPAADRVQHYDEFVIPLDDAEISAQGARCMDCGIPYCHDGCPVNNIIPDWNDLVFSNEWETALDVLHSTNNFPEFTGRVCPAPCEAACTLNIDDNPVTIKTIECAIVDKGWEQGWIKPQIAAHKTGKKIAVVGSGPAGMAASQQLARAGHVVELFEKSSRIGGLMRYGIPDFKMEKHIIDRRMSQMQAEGVVFHTDTHIGADIPVQKLLDDFDAIVVSGGSESSRGLPVKGHELEGVCQAMDFLPQQNKRNAGDTIPETESISAAGKKVVVIGGGDTGSDCIGTSFRQNATSVTQIEIMPQPPEKEDKGLTWPYWPLKMRTSSSQDEGAERDWAIATQSFEGQDGRVTALNCVRVEWNQDDHGQWKMQNVADSEFQIEADLVLLAMGFVHPTHEGMLTDLDLKLDGRGNVDADTTSYQTSNPQVFAAGDMRRGQSLIVWAIREGRQCARAVDEFLMGSSELPR